MCHIVKYLNLKLAHIYCKKMIFYSPEQEEQLASLF